VDFSSAFINAESNRTDHDEAVASERCRMTYSVRCRLTTMVHQGY
jgi:hypothetical protein